MTITLGEKVPGTRITPLRFESYPKSQGGNRGAICKCDCGTEWKVALTAIRRGKTVSCGCKRIDNNRSRGYSDLDVARVLSVRTTETNGGCLEFQGFRNQDGYGIICFRGKIMGAHRVAWMIKNGKIPDGMYILHRCDNPPCCNVDHLFIGTQKDNMQDCVSKGRLTRNPRKGDRHPLSKIKERDIPEIRFLLQGGTSQTVIARRFGVSRSTIEQIKYGKTWKHIKTAMEVRDRMNGTKPNGSKGE